MSTQQPLELINAAVFHSGARRFRNVNVDANAETITVKNMVNGDPITTFKILEVVKQGEAWMAVNDGDASLPPIQIVAQLGCGCSGMKPWTPDADYVAAHVNG